ncbi:hypothetical protein NW768_012105 [Fusarium equiseti]|uniref:Heterokaryon incompatibility domain-containing protein n=1 Tax=Fusarium equiseti TaxID=61235 RepID=A0ABQ8QW26_FUSEQ|nr:hypothetical protein NW768_012105 [Fusarium equiseti]
MDKTTLARQHTNAKIYEYIPLSDRQIRLIRLNPADQESDELNGELVVKGLEEFSPLHRSGSADATESESLSPEKHVCFDAISYVWGEGTFTDIFVTPQGSIPITASLASILRRLRDKEGEEQLYWADGLCINQLDLAEKEVQVALMGFIYSSARKVFCDIGEGTEETTLLLDAMQRYWKRNIRRGFIVGQGSSLVLSGPSTAKIMDIPYPTDEEADAIEEIKGDGWPRRLFKFFSAPWFHRLWIVQEFVLGQKVFMVIGRRCIPWGEVWAGFVRYKGARIPWMSHEITQDDLTNVLMSYNLMCLVRSARRIDLNTVHGLEFHKIINILLCGVEMNQADLPICMLLFCTHGCTQPRDRYFGILGLINDEDKEKSRSLRPDYTSSLRDVTMRYWKYALQTKFGGELILSAGLPGQTEGYPSWIRDFSVPKPLSRIPVGNSLTTAWHAAGGPTSTWSATFSNNDPDLLFVQGRHIDDVTEMSTRNIPNSSGFTWMAQWLDEAFSFYQAGSNPANDNLDRRYPLTGEPFHEAALKVVMSFNQADTMSPDDDDVFRTMLRIGLSVPSIASSEKVKGEDLERKVLSAFEKEEYTLRQLYRRISEKRSMRLYKTGMGLFAMLRPEVEIGDSIWVLKGCGLPVVLRPSLLYPESFEFVGGGYVYGIMNGEMLDKDGFTWQIVSLR